MNSQAQEFDFIIAGGGMAGLSLAYRLSRSTSLGNKRVLVIDKDEKTANDHTWCFWETEDSVFEDVVHRSWDQLHFRGVDFESDFDIEPYKYKMIRSSDFYRFVKSEIDSNPSIEFRNEEVVSISGGEVQTKNAVFRGLVFDSISIPEYDNPSDHNLVQPFLGYVIEVKEHIFDTGRFTMFDFEVPQENDCRFVYVLPLSSDKALVEYTLFTRKVPSPKSLEHDLNSYLRTNFGEYEVLETERGVIPMSDAKHVEQPFPRVIRIGQAAGYVKPSTGYSFKRTQNRLDKIVTRLEEANDQRAQFRMPTFDSMWKSLLDTVLLNVLKNNRYSAAHIFTRLFKANGATKMLRFLDEDTSLKEDFEVMATVPLWPFSKAAMAVLFAKLSD